jgi:cell division protease FtsH
MASKQQKGRDDKPGPDRGAGGGDPNLNWRGLVLFMVAFALIGGAFLFPRSQADTEISYSQFLELLQSKKVISNKDRPLELIVDQGSNTQTLSGSYLLTDPTAPDATAPPIDAAVTAPAKSNAAAPDAAQQYRRFRTTVFLQSSEELDRILQPYSLTVSKIVPNSNAVATAIFTFLPVFLILLMIYFFFRQQIRMAGKGALNFGKSKARVLSRDRNKVTFKDVAGADEAKEEVQEIVEFLKDPKRFQKLGGRIPKGVLMVGPPGTGKTLLARAIAGEADVPFFSISGSDFVEMFVGVGASRVRDMFEQGKKAAPCLIFIDEIDAVGRHRGHGLGGGHDEREQTLNALLVEMDGFDTQEGVIIIAATNRPDVLDPALLRPGRFDRQITVNLPDVKGREQILGVHARKIKVSEGVELATIARGTPGYSGAELANVINEAALLAARRGLKAVGMPELEEARDKVRWGKERRSLAMSEEEKTSTAWHEAGHAIVSVLLTHTDPLHKVTIIPRGHALGMAMYLPEGDKYSLRRKAATDGLAVAAAGRIAEELFTNDISTGASSDIRQMTRMARKMVCEWGMSDKMGMVEYGEHEDYVFLGRDISRSRDYSEATAQEIDHEVRNLCDEAYTRAKEIIVAQRDKLELIAKALLEFESLDGTHVKDIIEHGRMQNPPARRPLDPPQKSEPTGKPASSTDETEDDGPLPGDLAGVPAGA